ncbi:MAG: DUF349 domain-containing protein [Cytophagaceae bacterium]|nr:DUF349 domain-containing protein [Cytophagaceae bacterium]
MIEPSLEPASNIDEKVVINAENQTSETPETIVSVEEEITQESAPEITASVPQSSENISEEKMTDITATAEPTETTEEPEAEIKIDLPEVGDEIQEDLEEIEEISTVTHFDDDFSNYSKKDFVDLADKMLHAMQSRNLSVADVKNIDNVLKIVRVSFDDLHAQEKAEARKLYIAENGNQEGFDFRNDNYSIRFEGILIQIRDQRQAFFQKLEREREDYFEVKTRLLQQLREIVDTEEKGESKNNWEAFKKLQTEWKNAGNVNSPHNGTLWSAYNALVDRYFDIRSIQNELKDLDRKKI